MLNNFGQNFSLANLGASQGIKKNLDEKIQEKNQIYGYIGMEVCDLCQSGKLSVPQLEVYFGKLQEAEKEITALEAQLAAVKTKNLFGAGKCSCGCSLKSGAKFCPRCGKPAEPETLTCICGRGNTGKGMHLRRQNSSRTNHVHGMRPCNFIKRLYIGRKEA